MTTDESHDPPVDELDGPAGPTDRRLELAEGLFASYRQDQASGVLDARMRWKDIDKELLQITAGWASAASREMTDPDPVSLFGTAGYDWAFFVEAQNTIGFHQILETVASHKGDPPASATLKRYALDILRGRVHLTGAIRLVSGDEFLLATLPNVFQTFLPGLDPRKYPVLAQTVRVAAAAALPRAELYRLRGLDEEAKHDPDVTRVEMRRLEEIREEYQRLMDEAEKSSQDEDADKEEEVLVKALEVAGLSPEPDDDIEALERIMELAERVPVSDESVRRCAAAVELLVSRGHHTPSVARCVVAVGQLIERNDLMSELREKLVRHGARLLETDLDEQTGRELTALVASAWAAMGRMDRARTLLRELDKQSVPPEERLRLALMEVEALEDRREHGDAVDRLLAVLEDTREAEPVKRVPALQKLITLWPESRDNEALAQYADEVLEIVNKLGEPRRAVHLARAAVRLWMTGLKTRAMRAWTMIDEEKVRLASPPMLTEKVMALLRKAREKLDISAAKTVLG